MSGGRQLKDKRKQSTTPEKILRDSVGGKFTNATQRHILFAMELYAAQQSKEATELLKEVMNFHLGNGKYDFSHIPEDQRANESFDAWEVIKSKIKALLADGGKEGDGWKVKLFRIMDVELNELHSIHGDPVRIDQFSKGGSISVMFGEGKKKAAYWIRCSRQSTVTLDTTN